jgi:5-dehydro-2-deoxygluconokinase
VKDRAVEPLALWPSFSRAAELDLLCVGRAGVDLYALQKNTDLEEVQQFQKSYGGSPANIAVAVARLGGRSALLGVVADDALGRSVRNFLQRNGVEVSALRTSSDRALTSLALTEIRPEGCQVIIYRERAADLQLCEADVDEALIARSRAVLISGTALSVSPSREACLKVMRLARACGVLVLLDLDYRPYGWASVGEAAQVLGAACAQSDLVIGNDAELGLLLNDASRADDLDALRALAQALLTRTTRAVVLKQGQRGCELFTAGGRPLAVGTYRVTAQKPMGSGDAFAGALWWAVCQGQPWEHALRCGAAAAAINVSRDTCAEAMPRLDELTDFMRHHACGDYSDRPQS